jgi:hypothetical protein
MKINVFLIIICVAIAGLLTFGFFQATKGETYRILFTIGAFLSFFTTLGGLLAWKTPDGGSATNVKIVSVLFFIVLLIEHIIFSIAGINLTAYVIITGIILILFVLIFYLILRALR